jgi:thioredoxin-related protein
MKTAEQKHEYVLLNFSGSDWCIPCIRLEREVFEQTDFLSYADANLVMVKADFPRLRKNKQTEALQKQNDALAEKYNPSGVFPCTVLLDSHGKMIKKWEGNPGISSTGFINEIKTACGETQ